MRQERRRRDGIREVSNEVTWKRAQRGKLSPSFLINEKVYNAKEAATF
jgi:hypothetical protein